MRNMKVKLTEDLPAVVFYVQWRAIRSRLRNVDVETLEIVRTINRNRTLRGARYGRIWAKSLGCG